MPYTGAMSKAHSIAAQVDAETLADLTRLAEHMKCTLDHLVATAVCRFVNDEIGAITPDEFAGLPPYVETDPTALALDEADDVAAAALDAFLEVGEDDIAAGCVHSQEEVEAMFNVRWGKRNAA